MKSIIQPEEQRQCYLCGSVRALERHHIFGAYNRRKSEKYGLTVLLCHNCHNEPPRGAHHFKPFRLFFKKQNPLLQICTECCIMHIVSLNKLYKKSR